MKKPSKKINKKYEKQSTINCKIDKNDIIIDKNINNNSTNFSNYTNQNSNLVLENTFLQNVKSGKNNSKNKKIKIVNALNNYRKKITVRSKRSLDKKPNYVGFKKQIPLSKRLYRHPNLSYEEQQKQKNHAFQDEGIIINFESTVNKRILDMFDSLQSKTTIKPLLKELNKHSYVPVSSNNNEYFEMQKNLKNHTDNNTENDKKHFIKIQKSNDIKINKNMLNETTKDMNISQSLIKQQNRKNYINIQDHQKDVNNTTSSDILEYDPNKIPYVEVPDYSDIREESLDEKDRQMKEGKTDFIDPEISTNHDNSEENVKKLLKGSRQNLIKKNDSNFTNFKMYRNIKKMDNNNENKPDMADKPERSNDFKDSFERLKSDKFEENKEERLLKNLNELRNNKDNLNNSNIDKESEENSQENHEPREDPRETQEDTRSQSGPIIFDINEYRKPFDLDEFLKDDPIMKKLKLLEKETRTKYGQNGKQVSADFNESESDNAFREQANGQRNSAEVQDTFDDLSKSHRSSDFADSIFAKVDKIKDKQNRKDRKIKKKIKNREDSNEENSDEDFLRFIFKKDKKNNPLPGFENEEKFLSRYFTEDVIRNLQEDIEKDSKRKDKFRKEDMYEALSAILRKKNQVSRLNKDIDKRIETGNEPMLEYKNFWSLEYKSPRVDMEAQERRK